ncbi:MAG: cytochrome c maturation protein CcmE [Actinomycetota bacterium]|nr:cytochrome c maturation protein CcmE [Actinomycetota bacterium]
MRVRWAVVAVGCLAVAGMGFVVLKNNVVYLDPVSEAVADKADGRTRIGGAVVPGTIDGREGAVAFEMTEGGVVMDVVHEGSPPDLFEACAPVVVEGRWAGNTFESDRLLIRHGNEYEPPDGESYDDCPDAGDGSG